MPKDAMLTERSKSGLNESCKLTHVQKDGSLQKFCDTKITGFVGFKKRMELSLEAVQGGPNKEQQSPNNYNSRSATQNGSGSKTNYT